MWKPGFPHTASQPARLYGFHRRLCLWSTQYRGTVAQPGLILGLERGGSCRGMAFKSDDRNIKHTVRYLFERELITEAYQPMAIPIHLQCKTVVTALTFVAKTEHPQYAQRMEPKAAIALIRNAKGPMGTNVEYILNTVDHLNALGIHNTELHRIAAAL